MSDARLVLDHVLGLICADECGESLVLRGSAALLAYAGTGAREPHDLDWVVRPVQVVAAGGFPYVQDAVSVRTWPEAAHGATPVWGDDDLDHGGIHPRLPPDGLNWIDQVDQGELPQPHRDVIELLERNPVIDGDLRIDADRIAEDGTFGYAYSDDGGGVRLLVPWQRGDGKRGDGKRGDGSGGTLQLDFAYDEELPEPPRLAAIPRIDGEPPNVAWAATPSLSLMWKLQWLCLDQDDDGHAAGKDLYDAVLLAEMPDTRLSPRLLRLLGERLSESDPTAIAGWRVDRTDLPGDPADWLARLARALHDRVGFGRL